MTSNRVVSACAVLFLSLAAPDLSAANLYYNLTTELAKNHGPGAPHTSFNGVCQGDQDNDCLDDAMEWELINKLNPRYYLDEGENCALMWVYAQVRPSGPSVDVWRVDGRMKWVNVTYFYNYAKDCKTFDGHDGDSEHVRFFLYSQNLKTWTLDRAIYWRHSDNKTISGGHLANVGWDVARQVGQPNVPPVVAADQDGHGSWEARWAYGDECTADSTFPLIRTCFNEDRAIDSTPVPVTVLHNVGGPDLGLFGGPERWRPHPTHLTVVGTDAAYTVRNGRREYWKPGWRFCGWQCSNPTVCNCAGSLDGKLDKGSFTRQSRPITAADRGAPYTYDCWFSRNGGPEVPNQVTWTYKGQNPQGHLLYTAQDIGGTHYYRIWYSGANGFGERWILESVAPNDWLGTAKVTCNQFDVNFAGTVLLFNWSSACTNGVKQRCYGYQW